MMDDIRPKFPNPRNDNPSVLSFDKIDDDDLVWIGNECANSRALFPDFSSLLTSLFVFAGACFREVNPSTG